MIKLFSLPNRNLGKTFSKYFCSLSRYTQHELACHTNEYDWHPNFFLDEFFTIEIFLILFLNEYLKKKHLRKYLFPIFKHIYFLFISWKSLEGRSSKSKYQKFIPLPVSTHQTLPVRVISRVRCIYYYSLL